ncbi:MAG: hypothetical protein JST00_07770 [Deltaproteobacteria bacterium]|nr:hypothetical protein [Deltaproteobacteria bacterium]
MRRQGRVARVVGSMVVCALAACGGSEAGTDPVPSSGLTTPPPSNDDTGAAPTTPAPTGPVDGAPGAPGAPCTGKPALKGDIEITVASGGRNRSVKVHVPPGYDPTKPTPVVLDFHGLSMTAATQDLLSRMNAKADQARFLSVHAEGVGLQQSWNAGACCGEAAQTKVDDVAHVGRILDELEARLCVDTKRVFATGMSNGAALSHRLACELSSRIAAIAPVAHVITVPQSSCKPSRPVSVLSFNGTSDGLVPYGGNGLFPSVADTMRLWATLDGCAATPRETSKKGDVTCTAFDGCKAGNEVRLCTVQGGGHTWPGGAPAGLGKTTNDISATDAMWDFFVKHPMP